MSANPPACLYPNGSVVLGKVNFLDWHSCKVISPTQLDPAPSFQRLHFSRHLHPKFLQYTHLPPFSSPLLKASHGPTTSCLLSCKPKHTIPIATLFFPIFQKLSPAAVDVHYCRFLSSIPNIYPSIYNLPVSPILSLSCLLFSDFKHVQFSPNPVFDRTMPQPKDVQFPESVNTLPYTAKGLLLRLINWVPWAGEIVLGSPGRLSVITKILIRRREGSQRRRTAAAEVRVMKRGDHDLRHADNL